MRTVTFEHLCKCNCKQSKRANLIYPLADKVHVHGALASSVSPRTVSASGTTAMAFSAAAFLSFAAPAPLFTLLFVSAPTSSLPGAWTSAPAPTSPFPEIVQDNANFWKLLLFIHFIFVNIFEDKRHEVKIQKKFRTYFLFWSSCPLA